MLNPGSIIGKSWTIRQQIGEGACAKVYLAEDRGNALDYEVVLKVIPMGGGTKSKRDKEQERLCDTLYYEFVLYTGLLNDFPYRPRTPPKFGGLDEQQRVRYLAMEKLDMDLVSMCKQSPPTISTVGNIGLTILEGLMWLHKKTFLFIDVKPENFMLKGDKVFFVDFGLVERISNNAGKGRQFAGTPAFCSVKSHKGMDPYYPDDIEAMGYVLLSLFSEGQLPWSSAKSDADCLREKENYNIEALATSYGCIELFHIIEECRNATQGQQPNYNKFIGYLQAMKSRKGSAASTTASAKQKQKKEPKVIDISAVDAKSSTKEEEGQREASAALKRTLPKAAVTTAATKATSAKSTRAKVESTAQDKDSVMETVVEEFAAADFPPSPVRKRRVVATTATIEVTTGTEERRASLRSSMSPEKKKVPTQSVAIVPPPTPPVVVAPATAKQSSRVKAVAAAATTSKKASSSSSSSAAASSCYTLTVTEGPHVGLEQPLPYANDEEEVKIAIGRDPTANDVILAQDETVSSRHMTLKYTVSPNLVMQILIKDEGSTNRVEINSIRIAARRWKPLDIGDSVTIGDTKFTIKKKSE